MEYTYNSLTYPSLDSIYLDVAIRTKVQVDGLRRRHLKIQSGRRHARLDGLREGLLVFFVGVVFFCVAAAVYFLAHLLVAAAPVVMLASGVACAEINRCHRRRV